jgi:hypothetical protein
MSNLCERQQATVDGEPQSGWFYCKRCRQSTFVNWRPWMCYETCFRQFIRARHIAITPLE